jgi:hypothetical protein
LIGIFQRPHHDPTAVRPRCSLLRTRRACFSVTTSGEGWPFLYTVHLTLGVWSEVKPWLDETERRSAIQLAATMWLMNRCDKKCFSGPMFRALGDGNDFSTT